MHRPDLYQIFYVSRALASPRQVEDILDRARVLNGHRQVTGSLLYTGGHFAQVIEGPAATLAETMVAIAADSRHDNVRTLVKGRLAERRHGGTSLAYAAAPGANELIANLMDTRRVNTPRAQRVLELMFRP
ncbi:MAG TPA: BLUF domain-containing protein [Rhizobacter sp.]